ncbi:response regulator [Photobacterium sp. GJ3]|uniref:response regulator n=1 Tax=Photobacterium sp. GJ3 TaxID=2829502 RepID=UPI001B8BF25D|nr:response regulator [Photobacterium sp. GJ3]QUJ68878.1 response regulator [Photobacterium sp. GJ3]
MVSNFSQNLSSLNAAYSGDEQHIQQWLTIWTGESCVDHEVDVELYHHGNFKLSENSHHILLCQSVTDFKRTDRKLTKLLASPLYPDLLLDSLISISSGVTDEPLYIVNQFIGSVLVAEDNQINQLLIRKQLTKLGVDVQIVSDGEAAYSLLQQHHQDFDLLITDCHMPNMDGFELTNKIRSELPQFNDKPIIGCTAADVRAKPNCSYEYEFDDMLYKPYGIDKMARLLSLYLPLENNVSQEETVEVAQGHWWENFSDDEQEIMANIFLQSMSGDLDKLKKYQMKNQGDHNSIRQLSHRIKGGALSINIDEISDHAKRLEEATERRDENLDIYLSSLTQVMHKYIQQTEKWLKHNAN